MENEVQNQNIEQQAQVIPQTPPVEPKKKQVFEQRKSVGNDLTR